MWSRKGWSNNSGNRACNHICEQGRWSLLMSRRIHCQDALMTLTLGWQHWGNTKNEVLNVSAVLCWQPAMLTWFKRARVRQLLRVVAGQTGVLWVSQNKTKDTLWFKWVLRSLEVLQKVLTWMFGFFRNKHKPFAKCCPQPLTQFWCRRSPDVLWQQRWCRRHRAPRDTRDSLEPHTVLGETYCAKETLITLHMVLGIPQTWLEESVFSVQDITEFYI